MWLSKPDLELTNSPTEAIEQVFKRNNIKVNHDDIELYPKQVFKHIVETKEVETEEEKISEKNIEEAIRFIRRQRG